MKILPLSVFLIIIAVFISGCSSSSDTQSPGSTDASAIAGFWDVSEENDEGEQDTLYALISAGGVVTEYDFEQDAAGSGQNCYSISSSTITALGNNQFQQSDNVEGGFDTFTATRQGTVLTVSFIDEDDENGNGSTTDFLTESYNQLTGIDPASLNSCDQVPLATVPVLDGGGLVVGGFNATRGGDNTIDVGAYNTSLESHITGVSIVSTATLTEEFLNQIDVFLMDAVFNSGTSVSRLNLAETAALEAFVNNGGGLIVASDNPSFQSASNSFLTPFGLTSGGIASQGPHTASVIDRSTHSDVTDGPFGQVTTVSANNTGGFTVLGEFAALANWSSGPLIDSPALVARSFIGEGQGRIVAVADHQTIIAGLLDSETLFLNSVYFVSKGFTSNLNGSNTSLDDTPSSNPD